MSDLESRKGKEQKNERKKMFPATPHFFMVRLGLGAKI